MKSPSRKITSTHTPVGYSRAKGMWVWTADIVASRPDVLINGCVQSQITEIYIPYDTNIATIAQYQFFIDKATLSGITVHALDGDPTWCRTTGRQVGLDMIDQVHSYNTQSTLSQCFKAVHIDAEPHGLNGSAPEYPDYWNTDRANTIAQWLDNCELWIARAKGYNLIIGGAFTFWLDDSATILTPAKYGTKKVSEVLIDMFDYYAVMAYSDSAIEILDYVASEIDYAKAKKIMVGIETTSQSPETISFYDEGLDAINQAIKTVDDDLQNRDSYRGIAIHDFSQWEKYIIPVRDSKRILSNGRAVKLV